MARRTTGEVRYHRERVIRRRMNMIRWMDRGRVYEQPGHLSKRFPWTLHVFCNKDWISDSKDDSVRRNQIINRIYDEEQRQAVEGLA